MKELYMRQIVLIVMILVGCCAYADNMTVVDDADNSPVGGATVIGSSGMILGRTDSYGRIQISDSRDFPVTVRCIGYEPLSIMELADTARLVPASYELGELVVTPVDRPIMRVVCFAREYSSGITGADTLQLYCEYMTESFLAEENVKGYKGYDAKPSVRNAARYARMTKDGRDSIFRPSYNDDIRELSWFDFLAFLPTERIEAPEAIRNGFESDTVPGKYGPKFIFRKKNNLFTKTADVLSDHKNRKWSPWFLKLIGMTVDINAGSWSLSFRANPANTYSIRDFVSGTYNIQMLGRGKWLKKAFGTSYPIEMDTYIELYPVDIQHLTVSEYKERKDEFDRIPFQLPEAVQPLSPSIKTLVDRIDRDIPLKK